MNTIGAGLNFYIKQAHCHHTYIQKDKTTREAHAKEIEAGEDVPHDQSRDAGTHTPGRVPV